MSDIFSGRGLSVLYNTDTGNRSPQGVGNVAINEINTFPSLTIKSETNSFETYDSDYKTVLLSDKSVEPFQIVVNYLPDDDTHQFLDNAAESQKLFQVIIQFQLDMEENRITYAIVNGYITGAQLTGDKNSVVTKSYTFTPQDVIARTMSMTALLPISQGDYGVGSNTTDVPQYAPNVPTGNGFIKVPSTQAGNPAGADMMGVGLVDGTAVSSIAMTKTGTLSIYAKNATTAWTRIYTATQMDARYVPLTRTVNGKSLSTNVQIDSTDTGSLAISGNLSDVADVQAARDSLDVYSTDEVNATISEMKNDLNTAIENTDTRFTEVNDELNALTKDINTNYALKTNTINGHALSGNLVLTKKDVELSNVTDDAQLKIASNLGDISNVTKARENLSLERFVQEQALSYVQSGSTANRLFISNTGSWGALDSTGNPLPLPLVYGGTGANSVSGARNNLGLGTASVQNIGTSGATVPVLNGTNTWTSPQTFSTSVAINTLNLTNSLSVANGGTGGTTQAQAQNNLGLGIGNAPQFYGALLGSTATSGINNLRLYNSRFGSIFRMDGPNLLLLSTNDGDPNGSFNNNRLLTANLSSNEITISNLVLSNALPVASGGTGGRTVAEAKSSLGIAHVQSGSTQSNYLSPNGKYYLWVNDSGEWGAYSSTGEGNMALAVNKGGTGGRTISEARSNLDVYSKAESDALHGNWVAYTDPSVTPYIAFTSTSSSVYELIIQITRCSIKVRGIVRKTLDADNRSVMVVQKPLPGFTGFRMPYCPVLASQSAPTASYVDAITSVNGAARSVALAGNAATTWVMVDFEIAMM
ncbi:hypothetical protein ACFJ8K_001307 [Escherichia coli]|uniref:hypothetical protein n=1 Tax=Enterobacter sp. TaxID=42895 RepID=UPI00296FED33|nr:hypothetical protein [Enterobacter sp.]